MRLAVHSVACLLVVACARTAMAQTHVVEGTVVARGAPAPGAVVYLTAVGGTEPVQPARKRAVIDQREFRFEPRVLVVTPGSVVEFLNSDPLLHNVFSPGPADRGFDLGTYPQNEHRTHTFDTAGVHVILCHVHPEMVAYVLVVRATRHAIVDQHGRFRLDGVTPGAYTLHVWRRRGAAYARPLVLDAVDATPRPLTIVLP